MRVVQGMDGFSIGPDDDLRGPIQQRGAGAYTYCIPCNRITGRWYGGAFKWFVHQGAYILERSGGVVSLVHLYNVFPLHVLKQVVSMFFSVNHVNFRDHNPELARFVLMRRSQFLPRTIRVFVYFNHTGRYRSTPLQVMADLKTGQISCFSEIVMPPMGYVMTFGTEPPDPRLCEITEWTRYRYRQFDVLPLLIPVLPSHTFIGGDYRERDRIYKEAGLVPRSA